MQYEIFVCLNFEDPPKIVTPNREIFDSINLMPVSKYLYLSAKKRSVDVLNEIQCWSTYPLQKNYLHLCDVSLFYLMILCMLWSESEIHGWVVMAVSPLHLAGTLSFFNTHAAHVYPCECPPLAHSESWSWSMKFVDNTNNLSQSWGCLHFISYIRNHIEDPTILFYFILQQKTPRLCELRRWQQNVMDF